VPAAKLRLLDRIARRRRDPLAVPRAILTDGSCELCGVTEECCWSEHRSAWTCLNCHVGAGLAQDRMAA
jgi:hypothetical protein